MYEKTQTRNNYNNTQTVNLYESMLSRHIYNIVSSKAENHLILFKFTAMYTGSYYRVIFCFLFTFSITISWISHKSYCGYVRRAFNMSSRSVSYIYVSTYIFEYYITFAVPTEKFLQLKIPQIILIINR